MRYRIPFYFAFKLGFLCYLGNPDWKGASTIYESFLKVRDSCKGERFLVLRVSCSSKALRS